MVLVMVLSPLMSILSPFPANCARYHTKHATQYGFTQNTLHDMVRA